MIPTNALIIVSGVVYAKYAGNLMVGAKKRILNDEQRDQVDGYAIYVKQPNGCHFLMIEDLKKLFHVNFPCLC